MPGSERIVEANNHVVLWVGDVRQEDLDSYLEKRFPNDPGGLTSSFAREVRFPVETSCLAAFAHGSALEIGRLLEASGSPDGRLAAEAARRWKAGGFVSAYLLLIDHAFAHGAEGSICDGKLHLVGSWPHRYASQP